MLCEVALGKWKELYQPEDVEKLPGKPVNNINI